MRFFITNFTNKDRINLKKNAIGPNYVTVKKAKRNRAFYEKTFRVSSFHKIMNLRENACKH